MLALDGDKRPCRVRTSNAGHALLTGIARPTRAGRVVDDADEPLVLLRLGHPHGGDAPRRATTR